jgi:hypothetical protein
MDGYVFLRDLSAPTLAVLSDLVSEEQDSDGAPRIRAVATTTGQYDAIAFVEGSSIGELQDLVMNEIRGKAGAAFSETSIRVEVPEPDEESAWILPMAPKRRLVADQEAFVLVGVDGGRVVDVYASFADSESGLPGLLGAAVITGEYDILVELGAASFEELSKDVLAVGSFDGVAATETLFANFITSPSDLTA